MSTTQTAKRRRRQARKSLRYKPQHALNGAGRPVNRSGKK